VGASGGAPATYNVVRVITEDEYELYQAAVTDLTDNARRETFVLLMANHLEYQRYRDAFIARLGHGPMPNNLEAQQVGCELKWRMVNWLTSVRLFPDHTETQLSRRYGDDSAEFRRFKAACSSEFDTYFSYRFISGLRNYMLHVGLAGMTGSIRGQRGQDGKAEWTLSVFFERDLLLSSFGKWRSDVRTQLQQMSDTFPVDPHMEQMVECLGRVAATVHDIDLPSLKASAKLIQGLWDEGREIEGTPALVYMPDDGAEVSEDWQVLPLPRVN